jgi:hypothetical protein
MSEQLMESRAEEVRTTLRQCRNCDEPMLAGLAAECLNCGWQPGWLPVAQHQTQDGERATTFRA